MTATTVKQERPQGQSTFPIDHQSIPVRQTVEAGRGYWLQVLRIASIVLACDLFALATSFVGAFLICAFVIGSQLTSGVLLASFAICAVGQILSLWVLGLYPAIGVHPANELKLILGSALTVGAVLGMSSLAFGQSSSIAILVGLAFGLQVGCIPVMRSVARSITRRRDLSIPFFFLGQREEVLETYRDMHHFGWPMLKPVGRFDERDYDFDSSPLDRSLSSVHDQFELQFERESPYLGTAELMANEAVHHGVYWVIKVGESGRRTGPFRDRSACPSFPAELRLSSHTGKSSSGISLVSVGLANGLHVEDKLLLSSHVFVKRLMDVAISGSAILILLPVFLLIGLLVRLTSAGPVLYGSRRVGIRGKIFRAWKFRTMVCNADEVLNKYLDKHPDLRAEWDRHAKLKFDPRITWVGRILRKTSLDELPQLFNVLLGQMSLVGPRPMLESEIERYGDTYEHYLRVLPGITGLWQISGRNNTSYEDRLRFVQIYVQNWSPWMDFYILLRTIKTVLLCEGAY